METLRIGSYTSAVPIVQGGMGVGISLSGLASAVASQGGVGVISCAGLGLLYRHSDADFFKASVIGLREELRKAYEKTTGIIGVNIMVALTNFADMVRTAIEEKVHIIFSGAGLPLDLPSFLKKGCRTALVPIVSSARAARVICEKWKNAYDYLPDAVVVEGPKAGGHLGYKKDQIDDPAFSLERIVPQVVAQVAEFEKSTDKKIPVIAAGGIYTGEDMHRIMSLGASGVQLGTRFVTTRECDADLRFKQAYLQASASDIEIIPSPVGMPGRAISGEFLREVEKGTTRPKACRFHCIKTCNPARSPYCIIMALFNAFRGNLKKGYAFAGSNAFRSTRISSVREVMGELMQEFRSRRTASSSETAVAE